MTTMLIYYIDCPGEADTIAQMTGECFAVPSSRGDSTPFSVR